MLGDLHQVSDEPPVRLVDGVIASTPATPAGDVFVTIPAFDRSKTWGPCPWAPQGGLLPAAGDTCLLAFPEDGPNPWIIAWNTTRTGPMFEPLTFAADWSNLGAGFAPCEYTIAGDRFVTVHGVAQKTATWAVNDTIATLPAGFLPAASELFLCSGADSSGTSLAVRVRVDTAGAIAIRNTIPTVTTPANMTSLSLSGIRFLQAG